MTEHEQDYLLLSAYIDDALTEGERSALESRLQTEVELQQELDSLRQTVNLVRQMPILKAPRIYALDPAKFGRKPRQKIMRWQIFAPLAAAAALAIFVGIGLLGTGMEAEEAAQPVAVQQNEERAGDDEAPNAIQSTQPESEVALAATPTALPSPMPTLEPAQTQQAAAPATGVVSMTETAPSQQAAPLPTPTPIPTQSGDRQESEALSETDAVGQQASTEALSAPAQPPQDAQREPDAVAGGAFAEESEEGLGRDDTGTAGEQGQALDDNAAPAESSAEQPPPPAAPAADGTLQTLSQLVRGYLERLRAFFEILAERL